MALATTCPQCKTSFKVIPDQLKLRRGLVRCGVCQHVFSGIDYLRYVDDSGKGGKAGGGKPDGGPQALPARMPDGSRGGSRRSGPATTSAPQTVIATNDELKTAFFISDSVFGPYSQTRSPDNAGAAANPATGIASRDADARKPPAAKAPDDPALPARSRPPAATPPPDDGFVAGGAVMAPGGTSGRLGNGDPPTTTFSPSTSTGPERAGGAPTTPLQPAAVAGPAAPQAPGAGYGAPGSVGPSSRKPARAAASTHFPPLEDPDDLDVQVANRLAREAREARDAYRGEFSSGASRSTSGRSRRRSSSSTSIESLSELLRRPGRRATAIALAGLLVLQLSLLFRDEIAASLPFTRGLLSALAYPFGLAVYPVRSLADLGIESFDIQADGQDGQLILSALLRNRSDRMIRWPAMELTLTDATRAVVVRKVIAPTAYLTPGTRLDGIQARTEFPIRLKLEPRNVQLAGYTVALFYP